MGRAPCCEKNNGLKKGPWTPEEDQKLVDYIHKHGYGNWRLLPKNAGMYVMNPHQSFCTKSERKHMYIHTYTYIHKGFLFKLK